MRTRRSVRPVHALSGLLLAAALALAGCSAGGDSSAGSAADAGQGDAKAAAPDSAQGNAKGGAAASGSPKLPADRVIRTASLTVQVEDVDKALAQARAATVDAGGYVGEETTDRDEEDHERTRAVLRVPVGRYDAVLDGLQGAGRLIERTAQARDVGDQVVDVESRIRSRRASVTRVRELMDRATKLSDVVALEGQLSDREADLEALLARQASLKDRTSLATITLELTETPVRKTSHEAGFLDALAGGTSALGLTLRWVGLVIGAVLPFAVVAALVALAWLRLVRPALRRRPGRETVPSAQVTSAVPPAGQVPWTGPRQD
ncbi:DUF4349 domain-containing protein [Streptomyces sp. DSM 41014]|uniref:DUF4349 domain-containing protein n=1 Tax=Streptomyces hintoniae TaxID=3075521 RepID=A0ABU2UTZ3_9ACTN|nr:DUF4349 domain-containing protein [Streptomyces sp. DSM 41014]MDT0476748.1 DUF4349 domain-containing protein [Streptomyces sp. DSM 41014]